ncbi:MAG: hypothetical protein WCB04_03180 [Mycobacteriales bacterium]
MQYLTMDLTKARMNDLLDEADLDRQAHLAREGHRGERTAGRHSHQGGRVRRLLALR